MNIHEKLLKGWEYYWESGDFVLFRARPENVFPMDCDIFDTVLGNYSTPQGLVLDESGNPSEIASNLVLAMKSHGVPIVDDVSRFEGEGITLVRQKLSHQISTDEFKMRKKALSIKEQCILNERRQRHLERHPEQANASELQ